MIGHYHYIGPTPITAYGCVLCQREHRLGMDPEYQEHLYRQSKHGTYTRAPCGAAEEVVAAMLAEGGRSRRGSAENEVR